MSNNFLSSFFGEKSKPKRRRQVIDESTNKSKRKTTKITKTTRKKSSSSSKGDLKPKPSGSIKYKDYYFIDIKRSRTPGKKLDAVYKHVRTGTEKRIPFGSKKEKDYTQHKDRELMEFYDFKHRRKEKWSDLMSVGALNKYVLWSKPSVDGGISEYRKKLKGKSKKKS